MNDNQLQSEALAELLESQQRAIVEFRRTESRKAGRDIGWKTATDRWFDERFADWIRDERRAIDRVLAGAAPQVAPRAESLRLTDTQPLGETALAPV